MITNYPLLFLSEQLNASRQLHRDRSLAELSSGRRIIINSNSNYPQVSFASNKVNVYIPSISSSLLIQSLTFSLNSRSSLIITGPSGCGKSSLLRLLAGLQYNLTDNSSIYVPSRSSSIFLPQQLYLIEGTLREQLNYLRHAKNMSTCNNDQQSIQLWSRTLSLGEQQRLIIVVALVTLIRASNQDENNQIKHFILDETTAGCDELTEKTIYEYLRSSDVQYISISHRNELIKYHTHQLIINPRNRSYELVEHR
jgi:putative ATP-binding cassette transporter